MRYRPHTPVQALLREGDRVTGIQTQDGPEHAGIVVAAAGVWSPALLAGIGVDLPIETEFHQVAVLSHAPGQGAPVACIDSTTQTLLPARGGRQQDAGGQLHRPARRRPGHRPRPRPAQGRRPRSGRATRHHDGLGGGRRGLAGAGGGRVPALAEAGIAHGVTGVYDMTPDGRPMLGELPGLSGLVLAAGFSGTGFKISPAVGEAVAALVTGGPGRGQCGHRGVPAGPVRRGPAGGAPVPLLDDEL